MKFICNMSNTCLAISALNADGVNFYVRPEYDSNGTLGVRIIFRDHDEFYDYFAKHCIRNSRNEIAWDKDDDEFTCAYQNGVMYALIPS